MERLFLQVLQGGTQEQVKHHLKCLVPIQRQLHAKVVYVLLQQVEHYRRDDATAERQRKTV